MNQKITIRIIACLAAAAILVLGWRWFEEWSKDPENEAKAQTEGMIAAIALGDQGGQAVVFTTDGQRKDSPALKAGEDDREISWGSSGAHLFISSNRGGSAYNVYRWNPATGNFSRRSRGTRSQSAPWFIPDGSVESVRTGLMPAGGAVQILDPKFMTQAQVLPPLNVNEQAQGEEGKMGPMSGAYRDLGESFKEARWGPEKKIIYSVMRRDEGEVLVASPQEPNAEGVIPPPAPVAAGRRVLIDADAKGNLVFLIQDFQWPKPNEVPEEFIKDGKVTTPYRDGLFVIPAPQPGQSAALQPIVIFPEKEGIFGNELALSPDGSTVAVVMRKRKGEESEPLGLFRFPVAQDQAGQGGGLVQGPISSPSWSPDGKKLVYLKLQDGKNLVYSFDLSGMTENRVSDTATNYRSPRFSPARASQ